MADNVGQSTSSSSSFSLWVDSGRVLNCPKCTYVNGPTETRCSMCQFILPYREVPGNGGGGGDAAAAAAAVAACTTTANTVQKKRCRTGGVDEGRDGEDDEDDEGPLPSPSVPQDGVVMRWALPIVRLVEHGLSAATEKIKSAAFQFDRTASRSLALLEETVRRAEERLANAEEEVLAQINQRQEDSPAWARMRWCSCRLTWMWRGLCERRIPQPTAWCAHSHVRSIAKQLAFLGSIWRRRSRSCGYVMKLSPLLPSS